MQRTFNEKIGYFIKENFIKKMYLGIFLVFFSFTLCKKSNDSVNEPTKEPESQPITQSGGQPGTFSPLAKGDCQEIQTKLEKALKIKLKPSFDQAATLFEGRACSLEAKVKYSEFDYNSGQENIEKTIGWEVDINYAIGGPTGFGNGLKNGQKIIVYFVEMDDIDNPKSIDLKFDLAQKN